MAAPAGAPAGRVLLLGGLDPSGGAGVTVDATVVALHGLAPLPIATTTTVQGMRGFEDASPVPAKVWRRQLDVVLDDGPVAAVKVGYLGTPELVGDVTAALLELSRTAKVVVDPVLSATAGGMTGSAALAVAYREQLAPLAALITPNVPELVALADGDPAALLEAGAGAVLAKGGHGDGDDAVDELWGGAAPERFVRPRRSCGPVRGTGCALASAVASRLAQGATLSAACAGAGDWLAGLLASMQPRSDELPQPLPLSRGGTAPR